MIRGVTIAATLLGLVLLVVGLIAIRERGED